MAKAYTVATKADIGRLVKYLRKQQGLTQAELAAKSDTTSWNIIRLESSKYTHDLQFGTVRAILAGLGWQLVAMEKPKEKIDG